MNLIKYRFLFVVLTLASQLGLSETLGLIEVGKDASEIRNQFVIFRQRQAKNKNSEKDVVVFSICTDPQRTFSRRCAENQLKTSLDTNAYLAALTPVFNLQNYERLRQRLADQEESARRYRTQAGQAPESERAQIESDLQKGLQQISKTQTDLQGIRTSHTEYPTYHRILTALNGGEEGDETIPIFSSSNRALFSGAITPFTSWFRENVCTCSPMQEGAKESVCLLRKNGNVLAWMRSENGCATRNACMRGTWFAAARPSITPVRLNFDDFLNTQCSGYLNVGPTLQLYGSLATAIASIPTQVVPPPPRQRHQAASGVKDGVSAAPNVCAEQCASYSETSRIACSSTKVACASRCRRNYNEFLAPPGEALATRTAMLECLTRCVSASDACFARNIARYESCIDQCERAPQQRTQTEPSSARPPARSGVSEQRCRTFVRSADCWATSGCGWLTTQRCIFIDTRVCAEIGNSYIDCHDNATRSHCIFRNGACVDQ